MPTTPLRSVIAQQVSKLLDLDDGAYQPLREERPGSPPALKVIPGLAGHSSGPQWASLSTTSTGSHDLPPHRSLGLARGGPPSILPCTPTNRAKTPSVCGGSDAGMNSSLLGRQGSRAEVDRVVHRLHDEHSATREANRDRLVREYEHELRRTVTGRPQVDPRSRRMASDLPSIASRASKLLSAREASIADQKERIGREEGARHTPVINRRSRSLARTRKDLDTWAEDVRRRKEQRQVQHEAEMKAACTFAPNIYTRRGHKGGEKVEPVGERLLRAAEVSKAKIETKRKAIEAARMQQATFAPKITPHPSHNKKGSAGELQPAEGRQSPPAAESVPSAPIHRIGGTRDVFKRLTSASTGTNGSRPGQGSLRTVKHVSEEGVAPAVGKVAPDRGFGRAETNRWCEGVTVTSPSSFPVHSGSPLTISGRKRHSPITALGRLRTNDEPPQSSIADPRNGSGRGGSSTSIGVLYLFELKNTITFWSWQKRRSDERISTEPS
ncbi:hypothetical protein FOZ61_008333 [Perkinsus olseni]|uniref:Uncharacterized protein n=1 Tax=Perkinsus olseni TaxID=32597 RepID=A0A7J6L567_PEROL|nr:hypothetical protein FOZ61_008333 [Perkinsus olseni]